MVVKAVIAIVCATVLSLGITGGSNALIEAAEPGAFFVRAYAGESAPLCEDADTLTAEPAVADSVVRTPLFALNTNFFFEYATIFTGYNTVPLNIGVEVPIGQNWSAYADYIISTPWHAWNHNAECAELMHLAIGGRWYPRGLFLSPAARRIARETETSRLLDGMFAYASVGVGYYDFELLGKGYQGEEILGALGVGYSLSFNQNLGINFALGVGPLFTRYRYYEGRSNNEHLMFQYRGTWRYFGLTDAKISLVWLLYNNRKIKSQK